MRTERPCHWCGRPTLAARRVCSLCITVDRHARDVPRESHGLKNGAWVSGPGGVQRWVPGYPQIAQIPLRRKGSGGQAWENGASPNGASTPPGSNRRSILETNGG